MKIAKILLVPALIAGSAFAGSAMAGATCADLPKAAELKKVLVQVVDMNDSGGSGHLPWLVEMDATGTVCAVVSYLSSESGADVTTNMSGIGHRILAAHKANTSAMFSHDAIALSSANFYALTLPGGQMYGMNFPSSPLDVLNGRDPKTWGTVKDPMIGKKVGGFTVMAGGLPLYSTDKHKVGAIGISGSTFCSAHTIAWKIRERLADGAFAVKNVPGGVANGYKNDALIQDLSATNAPGTSFSSPSGFGHPVCSGNPPDATDEGSIVGNEAK